MLSEYTRIDLQGHDNSKFSWGGMPPDPPSLWQASPATNSRTPGCDSNSQPPIIKFLDPPLPHAHLPHLLHYLRRVYFTPTACRCTIKLLIVHAQKCRVFLTHAAQQQFMCCRPCTCLNLNVLTHSAGESVAKMIASEGSTFTPLQKYLSKVWH